MQPACRSVRAPQRLPIFSNSPQSCSRLSQLGVGSRTREHHLVTPVKQSLRQSPGRSMQSHGIHAGQSSSDKVAVLFVCLGNICRSPTAEAMFKAVVDQQGLSQKFFIDSCGTGGGSPNWYKRGGFSNHEGGPADERMTEHASRRDVHLTSRSRPLNPQDLHTFDYIIGMDVSNLQDIKTAVEYWEAQKLEPMPPPGWDKKLRSMVRFLRDEKFTSRFDEVPDPYFGGAEGFELVLDLLNDACSGLLDTIKQDSPLLQRS